MKLGFGYCAVGSECGTSTNFISNIRVGFLILILTIFIIVSDKFDHYMILYRYTDYWQVVTFSSYPKPSIIG